MGSQNSMSKQPTSAQRGESKVGPGLPPEEHQFMEKTDDQPAIEALSFAVCELKDDARWWPPEPPRYDKPAHAYPMGV